MKVIVFQGQSRYNVLRNISASYTKNLQEYGIEAITCDMNLIDSNMYLQIVDKFKPDFTIGFNPVTYVYDNNLSHYQKTQIPHIVNIGDNPYYHIFRRALKNPNDKYVYTTTTQTSFKHSLEELGVKRYSILPNNYAESEYQIDFKDKIYPTVFFGSYENPEKILLDLKKRTNSNQIYKIVNEFIKQIRDYVINGNELLPEPIELYFSNFLENSYNLPKQERIELTFKVFYFIDHYYRNLVRELVLSNFAKEGLEMYVFGGEDTKALLNQFNNVKVYQPIDYHDYINVLAHSKIALNITPMFKSNHERIPTTLANSTVLCTNIMDDLIGTNPDIVNTSIFYNLGNLKETVEIVKEVSENEQEYKELVEGGLLLAHQNFQFENHVSEILKINANAF